VTGCVEPKAHEEIDSILGNTPIMGWSEMTDYLNLGPRGTVSIFPY